VSGRHRASWKPALEPLEPRRVLDALSLADFYTEGKGSGLSFQQLEGFGLATTYETMIDGSLGKSARQGRPTEHATGESPLREDFQFNPAFVLDDSPGNLVGWSTSRGGTAPWLIRPELVGQPGAVQDLAYPTRYPSDSASTATTLYTGVKTYQGAVAVDIYEQPVSTILEQAQELGKATGTVSSVPLGHATPAAAISHHNYRYRRDADYPNLDNTLQQALRETLPTLILGGGHPINGSYSNVRPSTLAALRDPADGLYDQWTFIERGPDAADRLAAVAATIDPAAGEHLVGIFGARGQNGNLPWATADGDFSRTGTTGRTDATWPLADGETREAFIARELDENPRLDQLVAAALDVLEEDPDGFWLMIEGGDIDWAMHNNSIDNAVGAVLQFDQAVQTTIDWIDGHGGFDETLLIVTADHDHYLTLKDDYPQLAAERGLAALTPTSPWDGTGDADGNGHFWGSDPSNQFGWGSHTMIPVPVYYQGPSATMERLAGSVGQGFESYGYPIPGVEGMIDQVHIYQVMRDALSEGLAKNVVLMIGDGMGWEMARAAAIATQVQPPSPPYARLDPGGLLIVSRSFDDTVPAVQQENDVMRLQSDDQVIPIEVRGRLVGQLTRWLVAEIQYFGWDGDYRLLATVPWNAGGRIFAAGDANTDGAFDPLDVVQILRAAKYLTGQSATWQEGDFNGDGLSDPLDIVAALRVGNYLL
jgi:alkaline phosphatase